MENEASCCFRWAANDILMYRVSVTGTRSQRLAYRQSLWLVDM